MSENPPPKEAIVRYRDLTPAVACPHGEVTRIVTGGLGGVANVHVVRVGEGGRHHHRAYDEVYYVLSGEATLEVDGVAHVLRPGAVAVIPAGHAHALHAAGGQELEFVIFGTPAMSISDERARPLR